MKKYLTLIAVLLVGHASISQTTWSEHAAQVFYDNCTECHHNGGIGPMELMTYADAVTYAPLIQSNVAANIMPPWMADTGYVHFSQERILTQSERDIILDWISDGTLEGNPGLAPPPPVYSGDQILPGTPDMVVTAPNYMSKANTEDDYVCFEMNISIPTDKKVKAFEVIPGNREIVHHCLVYYDISGWADTDTTGGDCAGPVTSVLMGGYTPGSSPIIFPSTPNFSAGMELPQTATIVFAMHYPAGSYGMWDQTKVNFYFYDEPVNNFREVSCEPIIQDWSFTILADSFDSLQVSQVIPDEYTVLSVFPHMHLLGYYIETWAVTPTNDTINLCRIPLWDFDWQDFYWFQYMRHIPVGSTVYGKAVWNNTVTNPHNPNTPPQDVSAGLNTTDEMFLIYYHYMDYQAGDELIDIDSVTTEYLTFIDPPHLHEFVKIYPNPFNSSTDISYTLANNSYVSIFIYDIHGRLVNKLVRGEQLAGQHIVNWDGTTSSGEEVDNGIYIYSMMVDGVNYSGRVIKR